MQHIQFKFGSIGQGPRGGCVASIGTFDGVHIGHQAILQRLCQKALHLGMPAVVIVFEPQPYEFFSPENAPARIMRLREKINAFAAAGVDWVVCLRFNKALRQLTAEQFVEQILVQELGVKHLEIGDDFRFGCDRQGDFHMLQNAGQKYQFSVANCKTLLNQGDRVSSTLIRSLLQNGQLSEAEALLGRPFSLFGRVTYGRQLGQTIGAPTANLVLGKYKLPMRGVYAVVVHLTGETNAIWGVANLGYKPTVEAKQKPSLEVHLFNFNRNLYGQCIQVEFCKKIRDEQKFESIDALRNAIAQDVKQSKAFFGI